MKRYSTTLFLGIVLLTRQVVFSQAPADNLVEATSHEEEAVML